MIRINVLYGCESCHALREYNGPAASNGDALWRIEEDHYGLQGFCRGNFGNLDLFLASDIKGN